MILFNAVATVASKKNPGHRVARLRGGVGQFRRRYQRRRAVSDFHFAGLILPSVAVPVDFGFALRLFHVILGDVGFLRRTAIVKQKKIAHDPAVAADLDLFARLL